VNISSLSYSPLASTLRLRGAVATQGSSSTQAKESSATEAAEPSRRDQARISPMAQLVAKLQKLQASDPAKAQQALTQLASVVRDQQKAATGADAQRLGKLAGALQSAADTGDLSGLTAHAAGPRGAPPPPPASGAVDSDGDHDASPSHGVAMRAYAAAGASGGESKGSALMSMLNKTLDSFVSSAASSKVSVTA